MMSAIELKEWFDRVEYELRDLSLIELLQYEGAQGFNLSGRNIKIKILIGSEIKEVDCPKLRDELITAIGNYKLRNIV